MITLYTECLLTIADAYLDYGIKNGTLSIRHWHSLNVRAYRK